MVSSSLLAATAEAPSMASTNSQQMGVSPWYDWADVPVEHHDSIFVNKGIYTDGEPAVRYRGIFLNDEAPCLTSWVKNTYGTGYGDHRFYQRVFELVLRLRGNMMVYHVGLGFLCR